MAFWFSEIRPLRFALTTLLPQHWAVCSSGACTLHRLNFMKIYSIHSFKTRCIRPIRYKVKRRYHFNSLRYPHFFKLNCIGNIRQCDRSFVSCAGCILKFMPNSMRFTRVEMVINYKTFNVFRHNSFPLSSSSYKDVILNSMYCKIPMQYFHVSTFLAFHLRRTEFNWNSLIFRMEDFYVQKSIEFTDEMFFFVLSKNSLRLFNLPNRPTNWNHFFSLVFGLIILPWKIWRLLAC